MRGETSDYRLFDKVFSFTCFNPFLKHGFLCLSINMSRKCCAIVCVIVTLITLIAVGGIGFAYHHFVAPLFVITDNEGASKAIQNCIPRCEDSEFVSVTPSATVYMVSTPGHSTISKQASEDQTSVLTTVPQTWSPDLAASTTSSHTLDSHSPTLLSTSSATDFQSPVTPLVIVPTPTVKSDPPSFETSSYSISKKSFLFCCSGSSLTEFLFECARGYVEGT